MNSEFGLMHLWAQGDIVTRIVFVILASMSVLSWCVIIIKGLGILLRFSIWSYFPPVYLLRSG